MDECVTSVFGSGTGIATITPGDDVCPGAEMFDGVASWYEFGGALPHCSFPPDLFPPYYAAVNTADYAASATCGACVRVYYGGKQLDVMLIDECPTCGTYGPHQLDLNPEAFELLAPLEQGILGGTYDPAVPFQWHYVECDVTGDLEYAFKDGTTTYWTAIIFRNHPLALAAVEVRNLGGAWRELTRVEYNYWLDSQGFGTGPYDLRITDVAGNVLEIENAIGHITGEVTTVEFHSLGAQLPGCEAVTSG
jgi:expansin (peptidoglycan-binding protein)